LGPLAEAGAQVARAQAEAERIRQQEFSETEERNQLANAGRTILADIMARLLTRIQAEVPNANRTQGGLSLGRGHLELPFAWTRGPRPGAASPANAFPNSKWDVVAAEEITLDQENPDYRWSASLWYCRLPNTTDYRWYEASYFSPHVPDSVAPYSLANRFKDADLAAAPIVHMYQLAFGPSAIDDENEDDFTERWAALLALASQGKLGHPQALPLQPEFWRQHFVA
jgi:hypothetical protein